MPIINTITPPSLTEYQIEYDKEKLEVRAYPEPRIYKDEHGMCHFYCVLYPKDPKIALNNYILTRLPKEYTPKYWHLIAGGIAGIPKSGDDAVRNTVLFAQPSSVDGSLRLYCQDDYYAEKVQLTIQGTWLAAE